ncbi:MAG: hypothetical protein KGH76_05860, partial [Thaumarchaeota archaeon]|nr:hypothetical protein [Nitrososphaerota archaeon]
VSRRDRIVGRSSDPKKIPGFFVIDGLPDSHAWIVDKETQVEVSYDKIPEDINNMITEPGDLKAVIPVVQKISGEDFEATVSSIEVYDNCMKIQMYVKDTIVRQEDWASGLCTPAIRAWDDLGNKYVLNRYSGRGASTQFGDATWTKTNRINFSEVSCILAPTIDDNAHELTLSIEQLMWNIRKHIQPQNVAPVTERNTTVMKPVSRSEMKFAIHGGPWKFTVSLDKK